MTRVQMTGGHMAKVRAFAYGLVAVAALGACEAPPPGGPPVDNTVVFSADYSGGFTGFPHDLTNGPRLIVYADGRVMWLNPVRTMQYPQPALAMPTQSRLSPEGVSDVRRAATTAGLSVAHKWNGPQSCIADVGYSTYVFDGVATSVYASGDTVCQVSAEERAARTALAQLENSLLLGPEQALRDFLVEAPRPMRFERMAIAWEVAQGSGDPQFLKRAWPAELIPLGSAGPRKVSVGFCETRSGADAVGVWLLATQSHSATVFTQGSSSYRVWFHPMLPSETDCAAMVFPGA